MLKRYDVLQHVGPSSVEMIELRLAGGAFRLAASLGGPPSVVFTNALITDAETQP